MVRQDHNPFLYKQSFKFFFIDIFGQNEIFLFLKIIFRLPIVALNTGFRKTCYEISQ